MKKTFQQQQINGRDYQFLTLPGSDLFRFEIVNMYGANIERAVDHKKLYGLAHLIEHLGFRATKDYTTDELMTLIKTEGSYNASTDHDRINYFFETTSDRRSLAVRLVCNYALNDLRKIPQDEFELERKVVYNEAKRYADDDQTMFYFNATASMCGYHEEDNVIGIPETIETFTLDDAITMKADMQTYGRQVYNITYDPHKLGRDDIVEIIEAELERFDNGYRSISEAGDNYYRNMRDPRTGEFQVSNESEQAMTSICFDVVGSPCFTNQLGDREDSIHTTNVVNNYLSSYADTSLNNIIREKNGLTYGVHFYTSTISYKPYTFFGCDVSRGDEEKLMKLFTESIQSSVENYNEEAHLLLMKTTSLKRTLNNLNLKGYNAWLWKGIWYPEYVNEYKHGLAIDIDETVTLMDQDDCTQAKMETYMNRLLKAINNKEWSKVYT